jgi:phosphate transport system substrate-binding protein
MKQWRAVLAITGLVSFAAIDFARADEVIRFGGTGMGLKAMSILGGMFVKREPGVSLRVLPSLGSNGGIDALADGAIEVAIAARPLTPLERQRGIHEASCMKTALVFISSHPQPEGLKRDHLPAIFDDPAPVWSDGLPLKIINRSQVSMEMALLRREVPGMSEAMAKLATRRGIPVGTTDQENIALAESIAGSLTSASLLQMMAERPKLHILTLDGIPPSIATIKDGSYPFTFGVCLLLPAAPSPAAARFIAFTRSDEGRQALRLLGAIPSEVLHDTSGQ